MAHKEGRIGRRPPEVVEAIFVLVVLGFVVGAGLVGWFVSSEISSSAGNTPGAAAPPPGHTGPGLAAQVFGDPVQGSKIFVDKGCADCHSYNGQGGEDAPPLDYMRGHLSTREVANMSGEIWNHLPMMLPHFEEEGIPVPTFSGDEMADLIAYLHTPPGG